ncbi:hypothetical protein DFH05DRAFT_1479094 [Lentinula detonsa]|uniref:Uncharacterized protein n=1 Tax=Lentinula detonsa TaxID=2804962 RepID=A0A9W8P5C7_9AGAR|nr:hypothetical protein DFH05DRAFT_1479094 [Lentinula detonsa]KAJ3989822.1 hypothetical protein F5890DRAFT_1549370 [Lentinula detonsa]
MTSVENEAECVIQANPENGGSGEDKIKIENGSEDGDEDPYKLARMHASQLSVLSQNYTPVNNDLPIGTKDLPTKFQVEPKTLEPKAPKVYYGFGLYHIDCVDYLEAHHLESKLPPPKVRSGVYMWDICLTFVQHIAGCCNFGFIDILPPATEEYDMVLTLYDNHTIWGRELVDTEEEDVLSIMRREMPVLKDRELRWFYPLLE